jgi:alpha-D-ribose 1-methylphosphonate 5-triphosphate synthase subunit PhnG
LREQLMIRRKQVAEETAATKVDFYTMVRGEG